MGHEFSRVSRLLSSSHLPESQCPHHISGTKPYQYSGYTANVGRVNKKNQLLYPPKTVDDRQALSLRTKRTTVGQGASQQHSCPPCAFTEMYVSLKETTEVPSVWCHPVENKIHRVVSPTYLFPPAVTPTCREDIQTSSVNGFFFFLIYKIFEKFCLCLSGLKSVRLLPIPNWESERKATTFFTVPFTDLKILSQSTSWALAGFIIC